MMAMTTQKELLWLGEVLNDISDLVQIVSSTGTPLFTNCAGRAALGEAEPMRSFLSVAAPESLAHFEAAFTRALAGESTQGLSGALLFSEKKRLFVRGSVSPHRGASIEGVRFTLRDVTPETIELSLLRAQNPLYAQIFEHVDIGLTVWEPRDKADPQAFSLVARNEAAKQIFPEQREAIRPGATLSALAGPALAARLGPLLTRVEKEQKTEMGADETIGERTFSINVFPLPEGCVGLAFEDISQRKAVERMKSEFVSTVSHELRTPLTSIRGALGLLEGGVLGELPSDAMDVVHIARSSTDRLVRLINDILDLEKIEAGKLELRHGPVDISRLITSTVESLRALADEAGVELRIDASFHGEIMGDEDRLAQVLTNFASNALKFSPRGGYVDIRARSVKNGRVRLEVIDQGIGINEKDLARLFKRFEQLDGGDRRKTGGTGLGLSISKAIVEQHAGTIGVESVIGKGSTFWFELPGPRPKLVAPSSRKLAALVVEDDPSFVATLEPLLAGVGYSLLAASTLAEATVIASSNDISAILLDVRLPDGDGLALLEHLRRDERTMHIPVIVMTAYDSDAKAWAMPLVVDWLVKPFAPERLSDALRRAVHARVQARVLVVEDDAFCRDLLARQLGTLGAEVLVAADGVQGIEIARLSSPDLIVLDIGLPRGDGFDVVAALRDGETRGIPVIVYTGRDTTVVDRARLRLGITRYLTKSRVSERELLAHVRDLLNGIARLEIASPGKGASPSTIEDRSPL